MREQFLAKLITIVSEDCVRENELLSKHTTFRIGGPADLMILVKTPKQLSQVIRLCNDYHEPYYVLGKGSNLLAGDKGYRGTIIKLVATDKIEMFEASTKEYEEYAKEYNLSEMKESVIVRIPAGISLVNAAHEVAKQGLAGFEFASGIPGTLGGAVAMNAGAYGQEIKDTILEAKVVDQEGNIFTISKENLQLGYRKCIIQDSHYIAVEAVFIFAKGDVSKIKETIADLGRRRIEKQPLEFPSAGSTFRRPEGYFAGKLIMDAGLRGYQIGGARVSDKHCGFVINAGNATAKDVMDLVHYIQSVVKEKFNVDLETEIKMLGEF